MTQTQPDHVPVLKDHAGAYYLLTPEILDLARVPDAKRADLERALIAQGDTGGYMMSFGLRGYVSKVESNRTMKEQVRAAQRALELYKQAN